jgi:uncharacterized protein
MFYFDPIYFVFIAPGLLLALLASFITKSTFAKYSRVASSRGYTGAEAAHQMLIRNGIGNVQIEPVRGMLTDHYDPMSKTLRLSEGVYASNSLAAIGVACHEAGHAIQHAHGYAMLHLRTALVPPTNICSTLYAWVIMFGFFLSSPKLILVGVAMCAMAVVFAVVTLPVEWDASARAKVAMVNAGIVSSHESVDAGKVLNAAFLTYLASAITAILTLLYYLFRLGLLGRRGN